jgi:1-phosphofructokinase family hexose kinase
MILTVTLNPLLERRITYKSIISGDNNRNGKLEIKAGGKGINVSRQLNKLGIDNLALTFAGGFSGKEFKDVINEEKIKSVLIRTESPTREGLIFIDESAKSLTTCFAANSEINAKEAEEFRIKLEKMIPNYEMIILSGSSPCRETDSIFPSAIEWGNKQDKIIICDTYGRYLADCIKAGPTIIHNNVDEINKSLGMKLDTEEDKIKQAYITDGEKPFYAADFDFHFRIESPRVNAIDATGSGDAFTAGIAYGWMNDLVFADTLKTAVALGAANAATFEVCNNTLMDIEELKESVTITSVGKKMKLIDVTPTN